MVNHKHITDVEVVVLFDDNYYSLSFNRYESTYFRSKCRYYFKYITNIWYYRMNLHDDCYEYLTLSDMYESTTVTFRISKCGKYSLFMCDRVTYTSTTLNNLNKLTVTPF